MRFETYVAFRYLRSKRRNRFVSLITMISIAGVSVGVIALIVVMSVMTGFDNALRATIIGNRAHLTIEEQGYAQIEDVDQVMDQLMKLTPEIEAVGPIIEVQSLLRRKTQRSERTSFAYVVGVDPQRESEVTMLAENLTSEGGRTFGEGKLPGDKEIVIGYRLAMNLGADVGTQLEVITDKTSSTPLGPRRGQSLWLTVSGIFQAKMSDYDAAYGFVNIPTAQMLCARKGVDAIHCKLSDPFLADQIASMVEGLGFRTETWFESQAAFFGALAQEKLAMFIILVFIILVAAFNITSTLIMVVMEKRRDIGILRTLGSSGSSVLLLFILEGLFIGLSGTVIGVIAGTLLAYNINPVAEFLAGLFGIDLFNSQIYYFDRIPVAVVPWDIFWITVSAVVLTLLSTLYPAWSAARLDPVEALRYE